MKFKVIQKYILISTQSMRIKIMINQFLPDKAIDLIDEAGFQVRLRHVQEARELDKEVRKIVKEKEEVACNQDFEKEFKIKKKFPWIPVGIHFPAGIEDGDQFFPDITGRGWRRGQIPRWGLGMGISFPAPLPFLLT